MGLQVRLRHALGEKTLDLPCRGAGQPLLIGRDPDADVRVPSVSAAGRHCAVFLQEGQWVVQSVSGRTTVNGGPLAGAAPLRVGDVIGIGGDASAPTIRIDRADAIDGASGVVAVGVVARPNVRTMTDSDDDTVGWMSGVATTHIEVPRRERTSAGGILVGTVLVAAVLGGTGWVIRRHLSRPPEAAPLVPAPRIAGTNPSTTQPVRPRPAPDGEHRLLSKLVQPPDPAPTAPDAEAPAADATPPPGADPAWDDLQLARWRVKRQGMAVLQFDEYRQLHPGKFTRQLDQYTEDAVNWLYWQYVAHLWDKRERLSAQIKLHDLDLKAQPPGPFHDKLAKEKADFEEQKADVDNQLTNDLGYTKSFPPDLQDPKRLEALARDRDPAKYAILKNRILRYVRDHHGSVWWEGDQ